MNPLKNMLDLGVVNVVLLGVSFMFVFTTFQTSGIIQTNVIDSIKANDTSYHGDGYTAFGVLYGVFALAGWFAPSIVNLLGPKLSMILAAITYNLNVGQFLVPKTWGLYATSCLVGAGAGVLWTAQGTFLTQNSTKATMQRNSGIFWALLQLSLIWGNLFAYIEFNGQPNITPKIRETVYIALVSIGIVGNLLMIAFLKPPNVSSEEEKRQKFTKGMVDSAKLLKTPNMMLLFVVFLYTGIELSFFSNVYGACIGFTKKFGDDSTKFTPLNGIAIGVGEVLAGLAFSILGKYTAKLGRRAVVIMGTVCHLIAFSLAFINLPANSNVGDTWDSGIITPSIGLALFGSFLLGFGDGCYNTQIYSLIGSVYTENSAPGYALYKFAQSLFSAAAFLYARRILLPYQLLILAVAALCGCVCFFIVDGRAVKEAGETNAEEPAAAEE